MASRKEQKERLRQERLSAESEAQAQAQRSRRMQLFSLAAFLAIAVIAVLVVISQTGGGSGGDSSIEGTADVTDQLAGIPQEGTVLGDPGSKVTVAEYGDLQCPVCAEFSKAVTPDLISGPVAEGRANYEFRQWTIIGDDSVTAAKAALAAAEQNRYWQFIELFYLNQGTENSGYVTDDFLQSVAEAAGVPDIDKWNQDRDSDRFDAELARIDSEAQSLGLTGTPSIVVEGPGGTQKVASGSLADIESAISQAG